MSPVFKQDSVNFFNGTKIKLKMFNLKKKIETNIKMNTLLHKSLIVGHLNDMKIDKITNDDQSKKI